MRIDNNTDSLLEKFNFETSLSKAEILRSALRLLNHLSEAQKKYGEIKLITPKGKELLVILN